MLAVKVSGQTSLPANNDEQVSYLKRNSIKVNLLQFANGIIKIKLAHQRKGTYMVQLLNTESKTFVFFSPINQYSQWNTIHAIASSHRSSSICNKQQMIGNA